MTTHWKTMNTPRDRHPLRMGLALSAGGAKGAYQLGAWKAFQERGLRFRAVAGSSIGALNGAFVVQGDWNAARDFWRELSAMSVVQPDRENVTKLAVNLAGDIALLLLPIPNLRWLKILKYASSLVKTVSQHGVLGKLLRDGLLDLRELQPLASRYLDMPALLRSTKPLFVAVTGPSGQWNPLGQSRWFHVQHHSEDEAWQILGASMAIPFIFSSVEMGGTRYSDGGVGSWVPIEPLHAWGIRRVAMVATKPEFHLDPGQYPGSRFLVVRPQEALGRFPLATFQFTEAAFRTWSDLGYQDAIVALDGPDPWIPPAPDGEDRLQDAQ